jgi:hypothetical protein
MHVYSAVDGKKEVVMKETDNSAIEELHLIGANGS